MKTLGPEPLVHPTAQVQNCTFGQYCEVMADCHLLEVDMGDYSYCARGADIWATRIGKFSNIAAAARINPGNHPTTGASLHHFMYRSHQYWPEHADDDAFFEWRRSHRCEIGHDTWIGHGAIVLPGRSVGTGAVVGAGAVVTKDVPPYEIWAGNPARLIRPRFAPDMAGRLLALAWWDWEHEHIGAALADFGALTAEEFLAKYNG